MKTLKKYKLTIVGILFYVLFLICVLRYPLLLKNQSDGWLSFYGSYAGAIIGGILTFLSVLITINFTKQQMREEKRLSVIPFLNFTLTNISITDDHNYLRDTDVLFLVSMIDDDCYKVRFFLSIENVGLGTAIDLTIPNIEFLDNSITEKYSIISNNKKCFYNEIYNELLLDSQKETSFNVQYKDLLGNKYRQDITLNIYRIYGGEKPDDYYWNLNLKSFTSPELL